MLAGSIENHWMITARLSRIQADRDVELGIKLWWTSTRLLETILEPGSGTAAGLRQK
jgi:hypothetical protein